MGLVSFSVFTGLVDSKKPSSDLIEPRSSEDGGRRSGESKRLDPGSQRPLGEDGDGRSGK